MRRQTNDSQLLPFESANPKEVFARIRNFLAGRMVGATRDRALLEEVIKCLLSYHLEADETERESVATDADANKWYRSRFRQLKQEFKGLFSSDDEIQLDPAALIYVHRQFRTLRLDQAERDPIGDAYETFVGAVQKGEEGQFFTPLNAVRLVVDMVKPSPGETVVDPACGAGGFLVETALAWRGQGKTVAAESLVGVDKDKYLAQLARARLTLLLRSPARTCCADSLDWGHGSEEFQFAALEGAVDVVLTNPPFGRNIVAGSEHVATTFELAKKWKQDREGRWLPTIETAATTPPQVLFIERCVRLLRPGGRLGAIVPESLLSGKSYRYVSEYLGQHGRVLAVVGLPEALFKISGKGGTHTKTAALVFEKRAARPSHKKPKTLFMAEAKWCGHDSRGRRIPHDDLPAIAANFEKHGRGALGKASHTGFAVAEEDIEPGIYAPRFYDAELMASLAALEQTHDLVTVRQLVDRGELEITTGDEVGKLAYGTGDIPFIRTSDISSWEIKRDPKHLLSEDVYDSLRAKQDVREGDILMVRDGTYLIGTCALVTRYDTRIVYQSHIYKLRVKSGVTLDPFYLLAALSSVPVQRQIKARCLSQDIIDSLGDRIYDLKLPVPRDSRVRHEISEMVRRGIEERVLARELSRKACAAVVDASVLEQPEEIRRLKPA